MPMYVPGSFRSRNDPCPLLNPEVRLLVYEKLFKIDLSRVMVTREFPSHILQEMAVL